MTTASTHTTHTHRANRQRQLVAALVCGTIAFVVFPWMEFQLPLGEWVIEAALPWRGAIAGLVVGLLACNAVPRWQGAMIAIMDALVGLLILSCQPHHQEHRAVSVVLGVTLAPVAALGIAAVSLWVGRRTANTVAVLVVLVSFVWMAGLLGGEPGRHHTTYVQQVLQPLTSSPPRRCDAAIFARAYRAVKEGVPYYSAYGKALRDDPLKLEPYSAYHFREPYMFYVWKVLPGSDVESWWRYFVVFSLLVVGGAYLLVSHRAGSGLALLAAVLLSGPLAWFAWTDWFPFLEIWGGGLVLLAFACGMRRRWLLGAVLLTAAVATREQTLIFVPAFLVGLLLSDDRKRQVWALAVAAAGPVAVLALHVLMAPVPMGGDLSVKDWLHGGWSKFKDSLYFSLYFVPGIGRLGPVAAIIGIPVAALIGALQLRPAWRAVLAGTALMTGLVFLFVFRSFVWECYWGAILMPLDVAMMPLALAFLTRAGDGVPDAAQPRAEPA